MSIMDQTENVKKQYSDDKNLSVRIKLHAKHSTNKQGFFAWVFEKYRFSENSSILELGCGNGKQWDGRIGKLPYGCKLTLSDFSDGMLTVVKEKFSLFDNIDFQKIDIQNIPFTDDSFDVVIANHMLYHIPDLNKALSEVRRVLKSGGRFYSATNGNGGIRPFLHNAMKKFNPETKAFTQEWTFSLQNGGEILRRYFSSVERLDYEDSFAITETQDLMDWIKSCISIGNYSGSDLNKLYEYFEAIRIRDGAINIPKESGLFVSVK